MKIHLVIRTKELEEKVSQLTSDRVEKENQVKMLLEQVENLQELVDDSRSQVDNLTARNSELQLHLQDMNKRNADHLLQVRTGYLLHYINTAHLFWYYLQ